MQFAQSIDEQNLDYFFEGNNPQWLNYLETHGFCVIRSQVSENELTTTKNYIWEDLERLHGANQSDENTWGKIPNHGPGIMGNELPQTKGPWLIRGLESIRNIFSQIWKTDELLVSMDSVILWLPWWKNKNWIPHSEGLHIDQNPFRKPDRCCVQGMVPLLDVTDITGGLEVIPFSHLSDAQNRFKLLHPYLERNFSDWCVVRNHDNKNAKPILLKAKAGDLILWDSRLIHGGKVGTGYQMIKNQNHEVSNESNHESNRESNVMKTDDNTQSSASERNQSTNQSLHYQGLARMAIPICMTPRSFASNKILETRRRGFENGSTFTHWPHEAVVTNRIPKQKLSSSASNTTTSTETEKASTSIPYTPVSITTRVQELI
mmetsp:Transcript_5629/g.6991  ORF Transcript_5629/g.6991 Transcript_5629/m.6991 type:complete len:376 (-) Transcript_5629:127-1254(-)